MKEIRRTGPGDDATGASEAVPVARGGEVSLLGLANILLRHLRIVLGIPLVALAVSVVALAVQDDEYSATSAILPEVSGGSSNRLSGLAAQFGLDVGSSPAGESLDFYAALIKSREILSRVAVTRFAESPAGSRADSLQGTLLDVWEIEGNSTNSRVRQALTLLRERVAVSTDDATGLVRVRTTAESPELAEAINRRLLELLNEFNLERRRSRAAGERAFVGERLEVAEAEFEASEEAMEQFLEQNRRYESSPELAFEAARLQRRVEFAQQVYSSLLQTFEQARIEEVRNTPVFTVIERPDGSARSESPNPLIVLFAVALLGLVVSAGAAFFVEAIATQRGRNPDEYHEFLRLRRKLALDIRPVRSLHSGDANGRSRAGRDSDGHQPS